jgi:hypothetical protein
MRLMTAFMFILTISACGGGSDGESANYVPSVKVECSSAVVSDCALSSKPVFVGLVENLAMNCDNTLHGLNAAQRQLLFTVSGTATSGSNGIYLIATVSTWTNSSGGRQDVLNPGSYKVCAFVDSNGNGQLDTNEPVGSGQANAGDSYYILDSWATGT